MIENYQEAEGACCRLLIGMQSLPSDELRNVLSLGSGEGRIDNSTILRFKKKMAAEFRHQLTIGAPHNHDEAGLRRLSAQ